MLSDRELIFHSGSEFNFTHIPIEVIIEIFVSLLMVVFGTLQKFSNFQEIRFSHQSGDRKVKSIFKIKSAPLASKGGLISYFTENHIKKLQ